MCGIIGSMHILYILSTIYTENDRLDIGESCAVLRKPFLEAEFMDEIQTKVLRVFLLTIHSHLYSFALRFIFLQTYATSYSFYSSVKEDNLIENHTPFPIVKKSIQKPQVWEHSRLCPETSMKLNFHEFGFCRTCNRSSPLSVYIVQCTMYM